MKLKLRLSLAMPVFFFLLLLSACRREESLETGYTSVYAFQDTFGVCYSSNVVGTYQVGRQVGDSNYLELSLFVSVPGRYSINTDLQNGFSFTGTGSFNDTGMTTIRIPARGTPAQEGVTTLRLVQDSSYCEINVNVVAAGPINGGGTCNASVGGTFKKDTALTAANTVTVQHNYSAAGTFTVSTDTINGYYFNKSVTVAAPGNQTIILDGFGTPAALGTNNFTVRFGDGSTCGFPITVVAGTTGNPGGGCGTVNGSFTAGTATTAANTFTSSTHVYAATGSFNVTVTSTAPGLSASTVSVVTTSAGASPAITVPISGTPTTAGTYPVNIDFGDGTTCALSLTVLPGSTTPAGDTTMFPLAVGNWWSYNSPDDLSANPPDSVRTEVTAIETINGQSYFRLNRNPGGWGSQSAFGTMDNVLYFRRDASGGVYQNVNLDAEFGWNYTGTFTPQRGDLPVYLPGKAVGDSWYSDTWSMNAPTTVGTVQFRIKVTRVAPPSNTINWNTFTDLYTVLLEREHNDGSGWFNDNNFRRKHFARGVGLVQEDYEVMKSPIRYWHLQ